MKPLPTSRTAMPVQGVGGPTPPERIEALENLAARGTRVRSRRVRADPAQLAALELHTNAICTLADQGARAAWEIGAHYNAIARDRLAFLAGYETRDYLDQKVAGRIDATTVQLYATVQRRFSKEAVDRFGPMKLLRLSAYLLRTGKVIPREVAQLERIEIEVLDEDGTIGARPFPECSERQIVNAGRRLDLERALRADEQSRVLQKCIGEIRSATARGASPKLELRSGILGLELGFVAPSDLVPLAHAILATMDARRASSRRSPSRSRRTSGRG